MFRSIAVCVLVAFVASINVTLKKRSTLFLPYSYQSGAAYYELGKVAVEQISYDPENKILYTVGDLVIHAVDVSDPDNMVVLSYLEYPGMEFTDVEFCGGHVFASLDNHTNRANGKAMVFKAHDTQTNRMEEVLRIDVGAIPDMLKPTSDCSKLVVAVEGEAYEYPPSNIIDPPGRIIIVNFMEGIGGQMIISNMGFEVFNQITESLFSSGVRHVYRENNNPFSNDVEPEYVAFNTDETKAYVVLQENNAVAEVDMVNQVISKISGLGYKDWKNYNIDTSDRDNGISMLTHDIRGIYQPDSMVYFDFNGEGYLLMANEGDAKEYNYGDYQWTERVRGKNLPPLELSHIDLITRLQLSNDSLLGRHQFSTSPASRNKWDGHLEDLHTFGGRSWSIRRADDLSLIYDSGDDIATWTAAQYPDIFNGDMDNVQEVPFDQFDKRSDNKGAEPEDVTVGHVGDHILFFIGIERPGGIMVYSVKDDLTKPVFQDFYVGIPEFRGKTWQQMYLDRTVSELDPEDMKFYPANKSPTGNPVLFAAGSISGTVSLFDVDVRG